MNDSKADDPLLDHILKHNVAFQNPARLTSLYSDFAAQRTSNPDGYKANLEAWRQALAGAAKTGVEGGTDALVLHLRGEATRNRLAVKGLGKPSCLSVVVDECVEKRELFPLHEFLTSTKPLHQNPASGWLPRWNIPGAWEVALWGLQRIGLRSESQQTKAVQGDYVVAANVEEAASEVLSRVSKRDSSSPVYSLETFTRAFERVLPERRLSQLDIRILLTHLTRDKHAASIATSSETGEITAVKFAQPGRQQPKSAPPEITETDVTLASLLTLSQNLSLQIERLQQRIDDQEKAARAAVGASQKQRALAALRAKKLAETTLQRRVESQTTVDGAITGIEDAVGRVEVVNALEGASAVMTRLNKEIGGVERVERVIDSMREQMDVGEEIGQVINQVGEEVTVSDADVDDEMEELEREEEEKRKKEKEDKDMARLEQLPEVLKGGLDESSQEEPEDERHRKAAEETEKRLSKMSLQE